MLHQLDNRPAIALETRRLLTRWQADSSLDPASSAVIARVLRKTRGGSLAPWVLDVAMALGASTERALGAAAVADLLYAAIDFTDDVEDGDAAAYMGDASQPILVNTSAHLFVLAWRAASEWELLEPPGAGLSARLAALACGMFCGQRAELERTNWSITAYESMARATGGWQLEAYLTLACHAAHRAPEGVIEPASSMGMLLHLVHDHKSRDPRLMTLPGDEVVRMTRAAWDEFEATLARVEPCLREQMRAVVGRPPLPSAKDSNASPSA